MVIETPSVKPAGPPPREGAATVGRDVQRSAEALFETRSVAEIRTVRARPHFCPVPRPVCGPQGARRGCCGRR